MFLKNSILRFFLLSLILSFFIFSVKASLLYSDSFQNGYNSFWEINPGSDPPTLLSSGITGSSIAGHWSIIDLKIDGNNNYEIQFDIQINNENSDQTWGIGIGDSTINWKIINTLQSSLQLHDSIGNEKIVSWDKSKGIHHFKFLISPLNSSPIIVIEDNKEVGSLSSSLNFNMYMFWLSIQGYGDYEFSNFKLCDQDGCVAAPTNTPTPTSTPSPTEAPTPTPTPVEPKKVLVIPGMGGSWNKDAFLKCKLDNYAGEWTPWLIDGQSPYQSLITSLNQQGFEAIPFFYDWRKPVTASTTVLKNFIQANIPTNTFEVVGHSFGGLLARRFLEEETTNSRVDTLLTVGSPHQGAVLAYPSWSGGEMWVEDAQMRLGAALLQVGCLMAHHWTPQQTYEYLIPSFQNILPTFDYLKNNSGAYIPVATMNAKNNWLPTSFAFPFYGTKIGTVTGTGYNTLRDLVIRPQNAFERKIGIWNDGKPVGTKGYADGDGTVLATSSQVNGAQNIALPLDHLGLVTNETGIQTILNFLKDTPEALKNQPVQDAVPNKRTKSISALLVVVDGAHAILKNKNGKQYQDTDGQITLLNPEETTYTLIATPEMKLKAKYTIVVVQLFQDGTTKWKSYVRHDVLRKNFKLRFSTKQPTEDVLTDK